MSSTSPFILKKGLLVFLFFFVCVILCFLSTQATLTTTNGLQDDLVIQDSTHDLSPQAIGQTKLNFTKHRRGRDNNNIIDNNNDNSHKKIDDVLKKLDPSTKNDKEPFTGRQNVPKFGSTQRKKFEELKSRKQRIQQGKDKKHSKIPTPPQTEEFESNIKTKTSPQEEQQQPYQYASFDLTTFQTQEAQWKELKTLSANPATNINFPYDYIDPTTDERSYYELYETYHKQLSGGKPTKPISLRYLEYKWSEIMGADHPFPLLPKADGSVDEIIGTGRTVALSTEDMMNVQSQENDIKTTTTKKVNYQKLQTLAQYIQREEEELGQPIDARIYNLHNIMSNLSEAAQSDILDQHLEYFKNKYEGGDNTNNNQEDLKTTKFDTQQIIFDDLPPINPSNADLPWGNIRILTPDGVENTNSYFTGFETGYALPQTIFDIDHEVDFDVNPLQQIPLMSISFHPDIIFNDTDGQIAASNLNIICTIQSLIQQSDGTTSLGGLHTFTNDINSPSFNTLKYTARDIKTLYPQLTVSRSYSWLKGRGFTKGRLFLQCTFPFEFDPDLYVPYQRQTEWPLFRTMQIIPTIKTQDFEDKKQFRSAMATFKGIHRELQISQLVFAPFPLIGSPIFMPQVENAWWLSLQDAYGFNGGKTTIRLESTAPTAQATYEQPSSFRFLSPNCQRTTAFEMQQEQQGFAMNSNNNDPDQIDFLKKKNVRLGLHETPMHMTYDISDTEREAFKLKYSTYREELKEQILQQLQQQQDDKDQTNMMNKVQQLQIEQIFIEDYPILNELNIDTIMNKIMLSTKEENEKEQKQIENNNNNFDVMSILSPLTDVSTKAAELNVLSNNNDDDNNTQIDLQAQTELLLTNAIQSVKQKLNKAFVFNTLQQQTIDTNAQCDYPSAPSTGVDPYTHKTSTTATCYSSDGLRPIFHLEFLPCVTNSLATNPCSNQGVGTTLLVTLKQDFPPDVSYSAQRDTLDCYFSLGLLQIPGPRPAAFLGPHRSFDYTTNTIQFSMPTFLLPSTHPSQVEILVQDNNGSIVPRFDVGDNASGEEVLQFTIGLKTKTAAAYTLYRYLAMHPYSISGLPLRQYASDESGAFFQCAGTLLGLSTTIQGGRLSTRLVPLTNANTPGDSANHPLNQPQAIINCQLPTSHLLDYETFIHKAVTPRFGIGGSVSFPLTQPLSVPYKYPQIPYYEGGGALDYWLSKYPDGSDPITSALEPYSLYFFNFEISNLRSMSSVLDVYGYAGFTFTFPWHIMVSNAELQGTTLGSYFTTCYAQDLDDDGEYYLIDVFVESQGNLLTIGFVDTRTTEGPAADIPAKSTYLMCNAIPLVIRMPLTTHRNLEPILLRLYDGETSKKVIFAKSPATKEHYKLNWQSSLNDISIYSREPINKGLLSELSISFPRIDTFDTPYMESISITFPGVRFKTNTQLSAQCYITYTTWLDYDSDVNPYINDLTVSLPMLITTKNYERSTIYLSIDPRVNFDWRGMAYLNQQNMFRCDMNIIVEDYDAVRPYGTLQYGAVSHIRDLDTQQVPAFFFGASRTIPPFPNTFDLSANVELHYLDISSFTATSFGLGINYLPNLQFALGSTASGQHFIYSPYEFFSWDNFCRNGTNIIATVTGESIVTVDPITGETKANQITLPNNDKIYAKTKFVVNFNPSNWPMYCTFNTIILYNDPDNYSMGYFYSTQRETIINNFIHPPAKTLSPGILFETTNSSTASVTIFNSPIRSGDIVSLALYRPQSGDGATDNNEIGITTYFEDENYKITIEHTSTGGTTNDNNGNNNNNGGYNRLQSTSASLFNRQLKDSVTYMEVQQEQQQYDNKKQQRVILQQPVPMVNSANLRNTEPFAFVQRLHKMDGQNKIIKANNNNNNNNDNQQQFDTMAITTQQNINANANDNNINKKKTRSIYNQIKKQNNNNNNKKNEQEKEMTILERDTLTPYQPMTIITYEFKKDIGTEYSQSKYYLPTTIPNTPHPLLLGQFAASFNGLQRSIQTFIKPLHSNSTLQFSIKPPRQRGDRHVTTLQFRVTPQHSIANVHLFVDLFRMGLPIDNNNRCYLLSDTAANAEILHFVYTPESQYILTIDLPRLTGNVRHTIECYFTTTTLNDLEYPIQAILSEQRYGQHATAYAEAIPTPLPPQDAISFTLVTLNITGSYRIINTLNPINDLTFIFADYLLSIYDQQFKENNLNIYDIVLYSSKFINSYNATAYFLSQTYIVDQLLLQQQNNNNLLSFDNNMNNNKKKFIHQDYMKPFATHNINQQQTHLESVYNPPFYHNNQHALHYSYYTTSNRLGYYSYLNKKNVNNNNKINILNTVGNESKKTITTTTPFNTLQTSYDNIARIDTSTSSTELAAATIFEMSVQFRLPSYITPEHITAMFLSKENRTVYYQSYAYNINYKLSTTPDILLDEKRCYENDQCGASCANLCQLQIPCYTDFDCGTRYCNLSHLDSSNNVGTRSVSGSTVYSHAKQANTIPRGDKKQGFCDVRSHRDVYFDNAERIPQQQH